jgi:glycosyltransferase involved in cell wall biosynthesis
MPGPSHQQPPLSSAVGRQHAKSAFSSRLGSGWTKPSVRQSPGKRNVFLSKGHFWLNLRKSPRLALPASVTAHRGHCHACHGGFTEADFFRYDHAHKRITRNDESCSCCGPSTAALVGPFSAAEAGSAKAAEVGGCVAGTQDTHCRVPRHRDNEAMGSSHAVEVTVITPTFNRAHTLPRAYASLRQQTFREFEWIVVDDGSTDSTPQLFQEWRERSSFPILYTRQDNMGVHVARKRGVAMAHGRFCVGLDSDDWLLPNALDRFRQVWYSIPAERRDEFSGVAGRCAFPDGTKVGCDLPAHFLDSEEIELRWRFRITGDNSGMTKVDILRAFPSPEFENEKFVTEGIVHNRIALQYKTRYFDEVTEIKEYQDGGLTDLSRLTRMLSPSASILYYGELLDISDRLGRRGRFRTSANFTRFSLHAGQPLWRTRRGNDIGMWFASLPAAVLLWAGDQRTRLQTTHSQGGHA